MAFVVAAILGWVIGCNVGLLMSARVALIWNVLAGSVGAVIGCAVFDRLSAHGQPGEPMALGAACAGAVVVLAIHNAIRCRPRR